MVSEDRDRTLSVDPPTTRNLGFDISPTAFTLARSGKSIRWAQRGVVPIWVWPRSQPIISGEAPPDSKQRGKSMAQIIDAHVGDFGW